MDARPGDGDPAAVLRRKLDPLLTAAGFLAAQSDAAQLIWCMSQEKLHARFPGVGARVHVDGEPEDGRCTDLVVDASDDGSRLVSARLEVVDIADLAAGTEVEVLAATITTAPFEEGVAALRVVLERLLRDGGR